VTAAVLEIEGLSKRFGALTVTDRVALALYPNECHALIGPNGAGKSTLVHMVSGLLPADAGAIRFAGRDVTDLPAHKRAQAGLGRSFQITAVLPEFTALENVALAAQAAADSSFRFLGRAASEERLNERARSCLASLGLAERAGAIAGELSHGEKRLLELAVAIAPEPKALLLDEPMAGLGRGESAQLTETLNGLKARYPMLLIEHDMEAVFALADRVSVLVAGGLVATGSPAEIRRNEAARRAYLGEGAA
jgi:branched-chain amino acid transport system ATP-binding protein